jgi:hypothetical protein
MTTNHSTIANIDNGHVRVEYLLDAGPRISGIYLTGSDENQLAQVVLRVPTPYGDYVFRGGHRLWYAPESFPRTYMPDNNPIVVHPLTDGVRLEQSTEPVFGIDKAIEIHLDANRALLTLVHILKNNSALSIDLAPWAITQLNLGGVAILPQQTTPLDEYGYLPNRHLALWPYTRWNDARLNLSDRFISVQGKAELPPLKIGCFNRHGWLAYLRERVLFVKQFTPYPDLPHYDFNCNAEIYCNDQFIELETCAPIVKLEPGHQVTHQEVWHWRADVDEREIQNNFDSIHSWIEK